MKVWLYEVTSVYIFLHTTSVYQKIRMAYESRYQIAELYTKQQKMCKKQAEQLVFSNVTVFFLGCSFVFVFQQSNLSAKLT